jgi:hypothetical protein
MAYQLKILDAIAGIEPALPRRCDRRSHRRQWILGAPCRGPYRRRGRRCTSGPMAMVAMRSRSPGVPNTGTSWLALSSPRSSAQTGSPTPSIRCGMPG